MTPQDEARFTELEQRFNALKLKCDTWEQNLLAPALLTPGTLRFGANRSQLDNYGAQFRTEGSSTTALFFLDKDFLPNPNDATKYGILFGAVDTDALDPFANIGLAAKYATANAEFQSIAFDKTNDEAVHQLYVNVGNDLATVRHEMAGGRTFAQLLLSNTVLRLASFTADPGTLADGDVWYRSDTDTLHARINGATVSLGAGGGGMTMPVVFGTWDAVSLGMPLSVRAPTRDASLAWPSSDVRFYIPVLITEACTVVKVWWFNGAAVSGNVAFALYEEDGTRVFTTGSVAQANVSVVQESDIADQALTAGRYYMSISLDNTTGRLYGFTPSVEELKTWGVAQEASAFTAPATATLADIASAVLPVIGMSLRTLVA